MASTKDVRGSTPRVRAALERSIKAAKRDGLIDLEKHAALIAVARKLANLLDDPSWPNPGGKFDNVTPAKFLDYCVRLGLAPAAPEAAKGQQKPVVSELDAWRAQKAEAIS